MNMSRFLVAVFICAVFALVAARPNDKQKKDIDHWISLLESVGKNHNEIEDADYEDVKKHISEDLTHLLDFLGDTSLSIQDQFKILRESGEFYLIRWHMERNMEEFEKTIKDEKYLYVDPCKVCESISDSDMECVVQSLKNLKEVVKSSIKKTMKRDITKAISLMYEVMAILVRVPDETVSESSEDIEDEVLDAITKHFCNRILPPTSPPSPTTTEFTLAAKRRGYEKRAELRREIMKLLKDLEN